MFIISQLVIHFLTGVEFLISEEMQFHILTSLQQMERIPYRSVFLLKRKSHHG